MAGPGRRREASGNLTGISNSLPGCKVGPGCRANSIIISISEYGTFC